MSFRILGQARYRECRWRKGRSRGRWLCGGDGGEECGDVDEEEDE